MAAIRKASMDYRATRGYNPENIYVSDELALILLGKKNWSIVCGEGPTGHVYDNNHCTLSIYVVAPYLGKYFNCIGNEEDYQTAVAEHILLGSTDSNSTAEDRHEICDRDSSNIISILSVRR